jgi:DNA-binding CsgD family transcriptional regulator
LTVGRVNFSEEQVSLAELKATEHFNDFVGPRRIGYHATGILLERRANGLTSLSISDMKDDPQRRSHQKRLLQAISPHVRRSLALGRAIAAQQAASTATRAAFDRWPDAAFVLGSEGRLVTMNKAAAEMVSGGDCMSLDGDGSLRSFDDSINASVEAAVRKCIDVCGKLDVTVSGADRSGIILPRRSLAPPLHALFWPLPYVDEHPEFGANGRVLVMIFDPGRTQRTGVGWLVRRFRLAASEGALVEALVNGETLAEAAERFGIQLSTARTRLKAIQLKTGCSRQVDLVRLALSQPDVRQD